WRPPRAGPHHRRHAPDARSAHRPGQQRHAGRRQHAGVRQANETGRDERPGRIPRQPAPAGTGSGPAGCERATIIPHYSPQLVIGRAGGSLAMNPTFDAFVRSWPFEPWLLFALLLTCGVYLRGCLVLYRRDARRWRPRKLIAFMLGLIVIFLA